MSKRRITLASYSLTLTDISTATNPVFNNFGGRDLLDVLENLLNKWKSHAHKMTALGDAVKCIRLERDGRYLRGILEKGASGSEQDIADLEEKRTIHRMTKTQAMMIPYYFIFYVPEDKKKAIFICQRSGNASLHLLTEFLENLFRQEYPPFKLQSNYLFQRELLTDILESPQINEVRLIEHKWSSDRADNIFGATDKPISLVVSYRSRYNLPIGERLKRVLFGDGKPSELIENNIQPDEVTIVAKVGKRKQTFTFSDTGSKFRPYRDITEIVKLDSSNHPDYDSINAIASDYLEELAQHLYEVPSS